ncbi:MAG: lysine exporter protein LysE/YggA [uncultured bacterium]|nr:MAG: lysine exporter protein LysE/YggA [uncultured bacterium]
MEYLSQFIGLAVIALLGAMSPGADFVLVTRNSLVHSRKIGIYTAVGIGLGVLVHVFYTLAGIGLIISKSIILFNTIKYAGAIYLIYIGWKSLKAKPQSEEIELAKFSDKLKNISPIKALLSGIATNALNPKVTLFFLSLFIQFISAGTPFGVQILLGLETAFVIGAWFVIVALLFSNEILKKKIKKVGHWFERITGAALVLLGIKVALSTKE